MTTFQDHHIINEQFGKLINKALEGTEFKFNVNTRPANRIYLPTDSVFAGELGATRHIGKPHGASGYTKAIRVQITAIIEANSNNPAMLIQKLDEFALNVRGKLVTGQLSLIEPDGASVKMLFASKT